MTGKTHLAVGTAVSLAMYRPNTPALLAIGIGASMIGAVISDIDIGSSESHKKTDIISLFIILIVGLLCGIEKIFHLGLWQKIIADAGITKALISISIFFVVTILGKQTPHRSFMHSFLCMIILTSAVAFILPDAAWFFGTAFFTHLFLDLFNNKGVRLLYPLKTGICFKLFDSDGKFNSFLAWLGTLVSIVLIFISIYEIFFKL